MILENSLQQPPWPQGLRQSQQHSSMPESWSYWSGGGGKVRVSPAKTFPTSKEFSALKFKTIGAFLGLWVLSRLIPQNLIDPRSRLRSGRIQVASRVNLADPGSGPPSPWVPDGQWWPFARWPGSACRWWLPAGPRTAPCPRNHWWWGRSEFEPCRLQPGRWSRSRLVQ